MRLNFFSVLIIILLLTFLLAPAISLAQEGEGQEKGLKAKIEELYSNVVNIAFPIVVVILIFAGYMYITSTGNPETLGMAKNLIFGAISGLIILLLAGLILRTVGQTPTYYPTTSDQGSDQPTGTTPSGEPGTTDSPGETPATVPTNDGS